MPEWADEAPEAPKPQAPKPPVDDSMPGPGEALVQGIGAGIGHTLQAPGALAGKAPGEDIPPSPAAAPMEWGDVASPYSKLLPKVAYGLGQSAPTLAGGIAGGLAGSLVGPEGTLLGGAAGAGLGAAAQSVAPFFKEELQKAPGDPNGAYTRALERAGTSGAFSALGWAAFPMRLAEGPLKQIMFQTFGVQAPISAAEQGVQNVIQGRPTTEGMGRAYASGAVGAAIPLTGHALLGRLESTKAQVDAERAKDPILSRLGDPDEANMPWYKSKAGWQRQWGQLYTAAKDDLNPLNEMTDILANGEKLPMDSDPYRLARITRGSAGRAEAFIKYGAFDPVTGKQIGPSLEKIFAPFADDTDGFLKYIMSRRAIELDTQGRKTGIPINEAKKYVAENPKYQESFKGWQDFNKTLPQVLVSGGLLSKEGAKAMTELHKDYAPMYRLLTDPQKYFGPSSPGSGMKSWNPIKRLTEEGSELKILNPLESTIKNVYLYMALADRNLAMQALEKLHDSSPRGDEIMQKAPTQVHPIQVTGEEVERALRRQEIPFDRDPEGFNIFRPNAFRPADDEIAVFNNGKRTVYKTDPYYASAVNGLNREGANSLVKLLSFPAKLLRAGATLSPEFIARNPIRDQFSAFVFSTMGRGYVPFYDFVRGLVPALTAQIPYLRDIPGLRSAEPYQRFLSNQEQHYANWLRGGGANSALVSIDRNYIEDLVNSMKDPTLMGTMKNVVRSPLHMLQVMSELMENSTRIGENMRLLQSGVSPKEAGFGSREITLDFQRMGAKMRSVNSLIAFFNAQLEGVDRAARSMMEQPFGFAAKVGAAITLPSIGLWWANKDDPRMKEIPRWEKDIFWIVPTDNWQPVSAQEAAKAPKGYARQKPDGSWELNKGNIWRIPKPFELGVMFGSVPERILDAYYTDNPHAFRNLGSSIQQAFTPNFTPQAVSPLIEQYSNSSLFTGRPLVPQYLQGLIPQEQATPYTSDTATKIAGLIAKIPGMNESSFASPIIVENYIRAWTGGLGKHILDASDAVLRGAGLSPTKVSPTLTNADKTLIRAFAVRFPEGGANSIQDFYEEFDRRNKLKTTVKYLAKQGEAEKARELQQSAALETADGIKRAMGAQFKLVRDTYRNPKMTADQKRQFIDMTYLQLIKMAQAGNEVFRKTDEAFKAKQP